MAETPLVSAAHELRTPLSIGTAALDAIDAYGEITKIKADMARMNRLEDQLLRVARLDAVALDVSDRVDLNEVAADIVGSMAPCRWPRRSRSRFMAKEIRSSSKGTGYAIGDAIRNLVENA